MTEMVHVENEEELTSYHDTHAEFKSAIQSGLSLAKKKIQSKYFYDDHGSELFNQITRHPDYYLTCCEMDILNTYKKEIAVNMQNAAFNLVELGPGEGIKTQILIDEFLQRKLDFSYMPIDISTNYLNKLLKQMKRHSPALKLTPIHSDFFGGLEWLSSHSQRPNLVLFLGSSIGNLDPQATHVFLTHLSQVLNKGDHVLIGFDLRKDVDVLMRAYNDYDGITRDFNLNLLTRMNRELQANFNHNKFKHYATYNVYTGAMESYLLSLEKQSIRIDALRSVFNFDLMESIHVECSYKYLQPQIASLASNNKFEMVQHFCDARNYFVDALWRVI